jgi:hypothetical protein
MKEAPQQLRASEITSQVDSNADVQYLQSENFITPRGKNREGISVGNCSRL